MKGTTVCLEVGRQNWFWRLGGGLEVNWSHRRICGFNEAFFARWHFLWAIFFGELELANISVSLEVCNTFRKDFYAHLFRLFWQGAFNAGMQSSLCIFSLHIQYKWRTVSERASECVNLVEEMLFFCEMFCLNCIHSSINSYFIFSNYLHENSRQKTNLETHLSEKGR